MQLCGTYSNFSKISSTDLESACYLKEKETINIFNVYNIKLAYGIKLENEDMYFFSPHLL